MKFPKIFRRGGQVHVPLVKEVQKDLERAFKHIREFQCPCGNVLRLRTRVPREDGPSNFQGVHDAISVEKYNLERRYIGHSIVASGKLNWNGLAEERGWDSNPVLCPACKLGLTTEDYKQKVREGLIVR